MGRKKQKGKSKGGNRRERERKKKGRDAVKTEIGDKCYKKGWEPPWKESKMMSRGRKDVREEVKQWMNKICFCEEHSSERGHRDPGISRCLFWPFTCSLHFLASLLFWERCCAILRYIFSQHYFLFFPPLVSWFNFSLTIKFTSSMLLCVYLFHPSLRSILLFLAKYPSELRTCLNCDELCPVLTFTAATGNKMG